MASNIHDLAGRNGRFYEVWPSYVLLDGEPGGKPAIRKRMLAGFDANSSPDGACHQRSLRGPAHLLEVPLLGGSSDALAPYGAGVFHQLLVRVMVGGLGGLDLNAHEEIRAIHDGSRASAAIGEVFGPAVFPQFGGHLALVGVRRLFGRPLSAARIVRSPGGRCRA